MSVNLFRDLGFDESSSEVREARVRASAAEVFTPEGVTIWFGRENRLLKGAPYKLIETEEGYERVLRLLEGLKDGVVF